MMRRMQSLVVAAIASASTLFATQAQAEVKRNPFGNSDVNVWIGQRDGRTRVCWEETATFARREQRVTGSNANGLTINLDVISGGGNDFIVVAGFAGGEFFSTACGEYRPVKHNNKLLKVGGMAGNDLMDCDNGKTDCLGGDGNDELRGGSSSGRLMGQAGDDKVFGSLFNPSNDRMFGGTGSDCLADGDSQHVTFDCGAGGNDSYSTFGGVPGGRVNCDEPVDTGPVGGCG